MMSEAIGDSFNMRCPSCGSSLGEVRLLEPDGQGSITCPTCRFAIGYDEDGWNVCVDLNPTREFSRQWRLWELGKLGDPNLVYGARAEQTVKDVLTSAGLTADRLKSMSILEVGFGNGALLGELQKYCPNAYGIDLAKPLVSASLRPRSTLFGSLFRIPFTPRQFDLVICRGVIHHTHDAASAFACIAEQVADGGTYFLTLYEPGIKKSLALRTFLPWSWRYPESVRLAIASVLGLSRAALDCLRTKQFSAKAIATYHGNAKLGIFDVISPRWTSMHPIAEVTGWFVAHGFSVRRTWPGDYVGQRRAS